MDSASIATTDVIVKNPLEAIAKLTGGEGVDVAMEAVGIFPKPSISVSASLEPTGLVTHRFKLDEIEKACDIFSDMAKGQAIKMLLTVDERVKADEITCLTGNSPI